MGRRPAWRAHHDVIAVDGGVDGAVLHVGRACVERLLREIPLAEGIRACGAEQEHLLPVVVDSKIPSVHRLHRVVVRAVDGALCDESEK